MGERPKGKTLDRKNSDGDYALDNCCWATASEQMKGRRKGWNDGEKNHRAVLNLEQVLEIRKVWDAIPITPGNGRRQRGVTYSTIRRLAAKYGVSFGCIAKLVYKDSWNSRG
jgi:hypothetical protein